MPIDNVNPAGIPITATQNVKCFGASSVRIQVITGSSLIGTFTGSMDGGTTYGAVPVWKFLQTIVDTDGASVALATGTFLDIDTRGLTDLLFTKVSGSGTLLLRMDPNPLPVYGSGVGSGGSVQVYSFISTGTDELLVSASARHVYSVSVFSLDATPVYVKLYDKSTAPDENDTPKYRDGLLSNSTAANGAKSNNPFGASIDLTSGLGVRAVTGIGDTNDSPLTANEVIVNIVWST